MPGIHKTRVFSKMYYCDENGNITEDVNKKLEELETGGNTILSVTLLPEGGSLSGKKEDRTHHLFIVYQT